MITVKRDNEKVIILVETDLAYDCKGTITTNLSFEWRCERPYMADVLFRYILTLFQKRIKKIREDAYNAGWHDAKAKRPKQDWFSGEM